MTMATLWEYYYIGAEILYTTRILINCVLDYRTLLKRMFMNLVVHFRILFSLLSLLLQQYTSNGS